MQIKVIVTDVWEGQTERQADKQTDRRTDGQMEGRNWRKNSGQVIINNVITPQSLYLTTFKLYKFFSKASRVKTIKRNGLNLSKNSN